MGLFNCDKVTDFLLNHSVLKSEVEEVKIR